MPIVYTPVSLTGRSKTTPKSVASGKSAPGNAVPDPRTCNECGGTLARPGTVSYCSRECRRVADNRRAWELEQERRTPAVLRVPVRITAQYKSGGQTELAAEVCTTGDVVTEIRRSLDDAAVSGDWDTVTIERLRER
jgi:hypothetical protein